MLLFSQRSIAHWHYWNLQPCGIKCLRRLRWRNSRKKFHLQQERGINNFLAPCTTHHTSLSAHTSKSAICSVDQKCGTTRHDTSGVRATWEFKPRIRYRKGSLAALCAWDQLKQQTVQQSCCTVVDAADPCWNGLPISERGVGG